MFPLPSKPESQTTFEDLFFENYARLKQWGLQLTGKDRWAAEDLVQELYVRFAGAGPVEDYIKDAEDYLFSVLRNLQYARTRRARTSALDDLSIVDYESAERGLRAVDRNKLLFVRGDLHRICDYLCERKNTSRSASIFILRYFLGYYPNEVMLVVQASRGAVDKAIRAARNEARLDLERPNVLRQFGNPREAKTPISDERDDSEGLFSALRTKIFKSRVGRCLNRASLEAKYRKPGQNFSTMELAHQASCRYCLDEVNRLLGLPLLEERSPDDTLGRDTPSDPGGSGGGSPTPIASHIQQKGNNSDELRKRLRHRMQEARQHRPVRLLIAVDGDFRASQRVTGQLSELRVELRSKEQPAFVEVLSEQSVCLAFVPVHALAPKEGLEQEKEIELSDGRSIKVAISFAVESATITVVYFDPVFQDEEEESRSAEPYTTVSRFEANSPAASFWSKSADRRRAQLGSRLLHLLSRMNPLIAGATLFAVCSIVCLVLWTWRRPEISAQSFLGQAQEADVQIPKSGLRGVVYQKVKITRQGRSLERAIYRDPEKKRRLKQQHLNAESQRTKDALDSAGVAWDDPLSPTSFGAWRDQQMKKRDSVARTGENLLTLTTSTEANGVVSSESLTVRKSDFHPVERTIELRDLGTIEIAELNYDVLPWGAVNQDWFEPVLGNRNIPNALPVFAVHASHALSLRELNKTELEVRYLLHQAGADLGDPIDVRINNEVSPPVSVVGIARSEAQKQELIAQMRQIPHVGVRLQTEEEATRAVLRDQSKIVKRAEPELVSAHSPIEEQLRDHFGDSSAVESFSSHAAAIADDLVANAWAIRRLSERYGPLGAAGEQALDPLSLQLLQTIRRDHLNAMEHATSELSTLLAPVLTSIAEPSEAPAPERSPLETAEEVRSLTVGLLSGTEATQATANDNPREAAKALLSALHRLEAMLKEQL